MNKSINISAQLACFILTLNETLLIIRMAYGQLLKSICRYNLIKIRATEVALRAYYGHWRFRLYRVEIIR